MDLWKVKTLFVFVSLSIFCSCLARNQASSEITLVSENVANNATNQEYRSNPSSLGIDLSKGYITTALMYDNGTIINLAKTKGTDNYVTLMTRLSKSSYHGYPSSSFFSEFVRKILLRLNRLNRNINIYFGRPPTAEIGILAEALSVVKPNLPSFIDLSIFVSNSIPGLSFELLQEAAKYAGVYMHYHQTQCFRGIDSFEAAYVGAGFGICRFDSLDNECKDEEAKMRGEPALDISYTNDSLTLAHSYGWKADTRYTMGTVVHTKLGASGLHSPWRENENWRKVFWWSVKSEIRAYIDRLSPMTDGIRLVTLVGEAANMPEFQAALKEVFENKYWKNCRMCGRVDPEAYETMKGYDPLFVSARGAAMWAYRHSLSYGTCGEDYDDDLTYLKSSL